MNPYPLTFKTLGASALLIEWPNKIDKNILNDILLLQSSIENELKGSLIETINAYNSLTVVFQSEIASFNEIKGKIHQLHSAPSPHKILVPRVWKIPVCYDKEFGIDLEEVARQHELSADEIIRIHSQAEYTIYFTGFLPGFLYLGGLPEVIHTPRKSTPRLRIKKGAVAIGGQQTGIYPSESPGGWNIIGNCPLLFFDPNNNPPCFAQAGDFLQFYSVNKMAHKLIESEVAAGKFNIESELL